MDRKTKRKKIEHFACLINDLLYNEGVHIGEVDELYTLGKKKVVKEIKALHGRIKKRDKQCADF